VPICSQKFAQALRHFSQVRSAWLRAPRVSINH
jgi:hypothetical protein